MTMPHSLTRRGIAARLERLPLLPWHWRTMAVLGIALSVEFIDNLALSFAIPILMKRWSLTIVEAGWLMSVTYLGQMLGSIMAGWGADRVGRVRPLRWSVAGLVIFGFAIAWSQTYLLFLSFRFLQGIAMGAALVLIFTYITEIAGSRIRGRLTFGLNVIGAVSVAGSSLLAGFVIPRFGIQWVFYIVSAISVPFFVFGRKLPESPLWLAAMGRGRDADRIVSLLEGMSPLAPGTHVADEQDSGAEPDRPGTWRDLLSRDYARLTLCLWVMATSIQSITVCLIGWLPTFFLKSYSLSIQSTLSMTSISYLAPVLAALLGMGISDRIGRNASILGSFACLIAALAALALFMGKVGIAAIVALSFVTVLSQMFLLQTFVLASTERYPTALRGLGAGAVRFWSAVSVIIGPMAAALVMSRFGVSATIAMLAGVAAVGLFAALASQGAGPRAETA